jgi:predicted  nucleic acid-binding Zn-ribbon protein
MKRIILFFGLIFLFACNQSGNQATADRMMDMEESSRAKMVSEMDQDQPSAQTQEMTSERKLIRKAYLEMEVNDYEKAREEILSLVETNDGTIERSEDRSSNYRKQSEMVIRVLPEKLDGLVESMAGLARNVERKAVETEDVSRQYIDLETRLESKRAVIERYQQLLQQAKNVSEVLEVEENLRKVTEEIESTEAQLRYLSNQIGKSTLYLTFYEPIERVTSTGPSFGKRIGNALKGGWQALLSVIVFFFEIWPFTILIALGIILFVRRRRRKAKS